LALVRADGGQLLEADRHRMPDPKALEIAFVKLTATLAATLA
jgi:hypothetical protein